MAVFMLLVVGLLAVFTVDTVQKRRQFLLKSK